MKLQRKHRKNSGVSIAEFAAVLVVGLPLLIAMIFAAMVVCQFFTIKAAMDVAARDAARALVVNYNNTGAKGSSVNFITIPNYVNSSSQFTVVWDTGSPPTFVTVSCMYPYNGSTGLQPFPNANIQYLGTTIFGLKGINVTGTFSMPVQ